MEQFIPMDKLLKFKKSKKQYRWRWDHCFDFKDKATIYINYGYTESELPEELILTFRYIDKEKDILKNQNIESDHVHNIKVPKPLQVGNSELPISFEIISGNKLLWKIFIEAKTKKATTNIYYTLGD